ncbi:MAG: alpha/beta hydrolase [Burkholderiaceae bacterium]|nr:alpha/beta hydrolase [Burkholderiaceae bacterium]
MATRMRGHITTLRGVGRMAIDATMGLTDLVQALHTRIARGPTRLGGPVIAGAINGITDLVYDSVRSVTRAVGEGLDATLAQLGPLIAALSDDAGRGAAAQSARPREALLAALNGVLGDYLEQTANPLAIKMALRRDGLPLVLTREALLAAIEAPGPRIVVMVHGLCMSDLQWQRGVIARARSVAADAVTSALADTLTDPAGPPHDHGAALARDLGASVLYLHYNSGLHVSTNGQAFAAQLEALVAAWPVAIERLVIVGFSMGGLLARSALHYGTAAGHAWPRHLQAMVFLGTPHHGAPLERGGHWIDQLLESTSYTAPFARLGRVRSAGITDLRHGSALDEDWHGRDRFAHGHDTRRPLPLPPDVACYAVAASAAHAKANRPAVEPVRAHGERAVVFPGDGLVPVASALGRHDDPRLALAFDPSRAAIAWDCGHLDLLSSAAVYKQLRCWLAPADDMAARAKEGARERPTRLTDAPVPP